MKLSMGSCVNFLFFCDIHKPFALPIMEAIANAEVAEVVAEAVTENAPEALSDEFPCAMGASGG